MKQTKVVITEPTAVAALTHTVPAELARAVRDNPGVAKLLSLAVGLEGLPCHAPSQAAKPGTKCGYATSENKPRLKGGLLNMKKNAARPKITAKLVKQFRLAAEQGEAEAQFHLGLAYYSGQGVEQDLAEAIKWYRLAAEQGDVKAWYQLSQAYQWAWALKKTRPSRPNGWV